MDQSVEQPRRQDPAPAAVDRLDALEQQVRQLTGRLAGWVEAQLAQSLEDRRSDMTALRSELEGVVEERLVGVVAEGRSPTTGGDGLEQRVRAAMSRLSESMERKLAEVTARVDELAQQMRLGGQVAPGAPGVRVGPDPGTARIEAFEQRVKAGVATFTELVETRLAESTSARQAEVEGLRAEMQKGLAQHATELRTEIGLAATALRARAGQTDERLDGLEQQYHQAGERIDRIVEGKLAEVVDRRRAELDGMKADLQESLAKQLSDARGEIGTAVADAHQRFVVSVDQLDERMNAVAGQATAAVTNVARLQDTIGSDSQRVEALELHTRLTELVEAKLAEVRAEVASALAESRKEIAAEAAQVEERRTALDRRAAQAVATLDALSSSVEAGLREAEERLGERITERLAGFDSVAAEVAEARAEVAASATSLGRKAARVQEQVDERMGAIADRLDALGEATARAASTEGSALAPLRSDMRLLQAQVAELVAVVAELPRRRKPTAAPTTGARGGAAKAGKPVKAARRGRATQ